MKLLKSYNMLALHSLLFSFVSISSTLDIITPSQPIRDGKNETLVSANGTFEAGFFSPENSNGRYLGIWYKDISPRTVVWVANRDNPLTDSTGVLKVDGNRGVLIILDRTGAQFWSSNASKTTQKPVVQLLDSGNLVVKDGNNLQNNLWQSFDYLGDTFLPGMKLGTNFKTGQYLALTSSETLQDPTPGKYSMHIDIRGLPQLVVTRGEDIIYRAGSWNGLGFTGTPELTTYPFIKFLFVLNEDEVFFENEILSSSIYMRSRLTPEGYPLRLIWSDQTKNWDVYYPSLYDKCENYAVCGENANCNVNSSQICECLTGFTAISPDSAGKFRGCVRKTKLDCYKGDSFQKYEGMKLPDTSFSWYDKTITLKDCERLCLSNCSCTAYANLNISGGGSGCVHWFNNVVDMRKLPNGGQDFYIRVTTGSELVNNRSFNMKQLKGIVIGFTIFVIAITVIGLIICIQMKKLIPPGIAKIIYWKDMRDKEDIGVPKIFDFSTISSATNHFSQSNKLGQGGFGPVYKGILASGQEIAVKRLSKTSGQGADEFKNEVMLIAKLQHRNLVKLLGCSIFQDEKLLIYEFMPNRSLDYFIFDSTNRKLLNWSTRLRIIDGIARGLLYLHQDSRLRIIHRDLKTSNILLDNDMNSKISDFGLARTFGGDQAESNTNRVMGTYGYMSPEYAAHGSFSIKSDVFSFGVIILEIISGRKNQRFCDPLRKLNLLGHAWRLWTEGRPTEFMDDLLKDSTTPFEILRCIHVGLLCVQQHPEDRPNMSSIVLMLNGEKLLPEPSQPGFYTERAQLIPADSSSKDYEESSIDKFSISLEAR